MGSAGTLATIPLAPGSVPVVGHALPLLRDPLTFLSSLPECGELVRLRLGPLSVVMVCDPALTRQVLLDEHTYDKGGPILDGARELLGDGLGTCRRSSHRRLRRLCQPAFQHERMAGYGAVMAELCNAAAGSWQSGQLVDITEEMSSLAMRIMTETIFSGTDPRLSQDIRDDFGAASSPGFWLMVMPPGFARIPTPGNRRYRRACARLRRTVGRIIADRRADGADHGDLLSSLLSAQDPESDPDHRGLSDEEVVHQVINIFAGAEATGPALAWALHLLAMHPRVAERLRREVDRVLAGEQAGFAHVPELQLVERVFFEGLRMYTPTWLGTRVMTEETELGGHRLPENTMIGWSPYLIHRRPDVFEEPDRFDPDRWLGVHPDRTAYFAFGAGGRKCIGQRFGTTIAVLALAAIVSRWQLLPQQDEPLTPTVRTTLTPRGVRLRVSPLH